MARGFIPIRRDQSMLLPENMNDWVSKNHPVRFFIDVVDELDLTDFYGSYRTGAQGRAAYDPKMMVALLLYAYANGIRSSREIERQIEDHAAFRIITSGDIIDHATICRFRQTHQQALEDLFVQVVGVCVAAGMVRTTVVAIDGTKIAANASQAANASDDQLKKLAAKIFAEAEAIDQQEDRTYGDRRGDEIPEDLVDRAARIDYLREELAKRKVPKRGGDKKINKTDPDSRVMKTPDGYVQGYNAQIAVSGDHFIVAADLTEEANDVNQLEPMIEQTQDNLEAAGAAEIRTVVADAGYLSADNVALDVSAGLLISPTTRGDLDDAIKSRPETNDHADKTALRRVRHDDHRRRLIMDAYVAKQITAREAASALHAPIASVYFWAAHLRKHGHLPRVKIYLPLPGPSASAIMLERLADPESRATYKLRAQTVEAVIGHLKEHRRLRQFLHRGRSACRVELRLTAAAQNLRRLWASRNSNPDKGWLPYLLANLHWA
jgi:transposase